MTYPFREKHRSGISNIKIIIARQNANNSGLDVGVFGYGRKTNDVVSREIAKTPTEAFLAVN